MSAQATIDEVYNLIKTSTNGITIEDIAKQYPGALLLPHLLAKLIIAGKIKSVPYGGMTLRYVAVENSQEPGSSN